MMFEWKPDMIRFMRDASEYGNYNSVLADIILPYLSGEDHVCDAGCGLGYLSLELSGKVRKVTAADINPDVLSVLEENCILRGIDNIRPLRSDVFSMTPEEKYSSMVFCYFGDTGKIVESAGRMCSGPIFIFKPDRDTHSFSVGSHKKKGESFEDSCRLLKEMGLVYRAFAFETEFGQPFRNESDALLFYRLYNHDDEGSQPGQFLDRLVKTGRKDFPLYLPNRKRIGCIILSEHKHMGHIPV